MLKLFQKIPGGIIIIPLLVVSVIATLFPSAPSYDGMTAALFSGDHATTIVALLIFIAGTQLTAKEIPEMLLRGGVLSITRILIGAAAAFLISSLCGSDGFLGISLLALVVTLTSCDPGVYLAIVNENGDDKDPPVFIILNLVAVPAIPLMILGLSGGTGIQLAPFLSTLVPFAVGFILGNIDEDLRELFSKATPALLFFVGVNLGAVMNWKDIFATGFSGIWLTVIYMAVSLPILVAVDRLILKRPGYAAVGMTNVTGVSIIMPAAIAEVLPQFAPYAAAAAAQISMAVILSKLLVIPLTTLSLKLWGGASGRKVRGKQNEGDRP